MNAADIMTRPVATVAPDAPLSEVIELLVEKRTGTLPVVDDGTVVGVIAEADLLRRAELGSAKKRPTSWLGLFLSEDARASAFVHAHGRLARDVMSAPAITVAEDTPLNEVAELLERRRIGRVPVVRGGRLVGVIGRAELLRVLASRIAPVPARSADDRELRERVVAAVERSGWLNGASDVTVMVEQGVVHLWGSVETDAVHRALVAAVAELPGVAGVRDHLAHAPHADPMDRPNWPSPAPP